METVLLKGIAALACSAAAYAHIRWRRNLAVASTRIQRQIAGLMPRRLQVPLFWSPGIWGAHATLVALLLIVFSVVLWGMFLRELIVGMPPAPPATGETPVGGPPAGETTASVFNVVLSALFSAFGLQTIIFRRRWARYVQWLHNTEVPLESTYAKEGSAPAVPPRRRWVVGTVAFGLYMLLLAVCFLWQAIRLFPLLR
jgi:hypothetical protein